MRALGGITRCHGGPAEAVLIAVLGGVNPYGGYGRVIGVNSAIYSQTGGSVGIGFAIPASVAKPITDRLMRGGYGPETSKRRHRPCR